MTGWSLYLLTASLLLSMPGCHGVPVLEFSAQRGDVTETLGTADPVGSAETVLPSLPPDHAWRILLSQELAGKTQWRPLELWPDPIAGPQAVKKLPANHFPQWELMNQGEVHSQLDIKNTQATPLHKDLQDLQTLAKEESLAGWNALILLSHLDPALATDDQKKLLQLVENPPHYSADSGLVWLPPTADGLAAEVSVESSDSKFSNWQAWTTRWNHQFSSKTGGTEATDETAAENTSTLTPVSPQDITEDDSEKRELSPEMRAAAAAGLIRVLASQTGSATARYTPLGQLLQETELPVKIRATIMRGIAAEIAPRLIPGLNDILDEEIEQTEPDELTLAALDACLIYALTHPECADAHSSPVKTWERTVHQSELDPQQLWPEPIWQYRWAEHPEVVHRFGLWLAIIKHPLAESYLQQAVQHVEPVTQWNSLRSLGLVSSPGRKTELLAWAETRTGQPRAVAVMAAAIDDPEVVYAYRADASPQVRSQVASVAGQHPEARTQQILIELAEDDDLSVQSAALQAIENWKPEFAFPVLSAAFISGAPATRKQARLLLEQQHQLVLAHLDDTPAGRRQVMNSLQQRLSFSDAANSLPLTDSPATASSSLPLPPELLAQFEDLLQQRDQPEISTPLKQEIDQQILQLWQQHPALIMQTLEAESVTVTADRIELFARQGQPLCRELAWLSDADLTRRRQGARKLAVQAEKETLPAWVINYLATVLPKEQDVHVCRGILQCIENDTTPAARLLVEQSLVHSWPDVRVLGCQYASRHRLPQLAPFLVPLLHSRNLSVQRAAIQAAGRCRNPVVIHGFPVAAHREDQLNSSGGLKSLLGSGSSETEWLVIEALAELGDDQGFQELRKLCYSPVLERKVAAMKKLTELRDEQSVALLIRIAWTEQQTSTRQTILHCLSELVPADQRPSLDASDSLEEHISAWSVWLDQQ